MKTEQLRAVYIASLMLLSSFLILFAQGMFAGVVNTYEKPIVEINRIDLNNEYFGDYSKVSVKIYNNDSVDHNFSIKVFNDEKIADTVNVTVISGKSFSYLTDVLPEKPVGFSNETGSCTLKTAKLLVYMDNSAKPIEETVFVFN
ncbi:MAG: hypothetical protein R2741_12870 [Methanolobus sp.]